MVHMNYSSSVEQKYATSWHQEKLYDENLVNRLQPGGKLMEDHSTAKHQQELKQARHKSCRKEATPFKPRLKLHEADWREQLKHCPTTIQRDIWQHETKKEYAAFLKQFGESIIFGEVLEESQKEQIKILLFAYT